LKVESRDEKYYSGALDSRREIINREYSTGGTQRRVLPFTWLRLSENNFLQTLRNKLTWGLDKRN
jgi:NAD+ kinase